ncbi:MAG: hypothetical protein ACLTS6_15315 [Anaerobutyricum sp.]
MFTRVDMKRHRNIEGSGSRTYDSKELCEQMGGQIYAKESICCFACCGKEADLQQYVCR